MPPAGGSESADPAFDEVEAAAAVVAVVATTPLLVLTTDETLELPEVTAWVVEDWMAVVEGWVAWAAVAED